jgi:hypothetical protein
VANLTLVTHRVVGKVDFPVADGEEALTGTVTRLLLRKGAMDGSGPGCYIVIDCMEYDGDISSPQDVKAIEEEGDHFADSKDAVAAFNEEDFDPADYLPCEDSECTDCGD